MSWEQATRGLYTTLNNKEYHLIQAPAYDFGKPSVVSSTSPLRLYRQIDNDGKSDYQPVIEVPLPDGCLDASVYLVRQASQDNTPSYRAILMPNDPMFFQPGDVRLFNFSPHTAMVRLNDTPFPLGPLEWKTMPAKPDHKFRVSVMSSLQVGGNWTGVGRALMSLRPQFRGEVLIVHTMAGFGETPAVAAGQAPRPLILASTEYSPPAS